MDIRKRPLTDWSAGVFGYTKASWGVGLLLTMRFGVYPKSLE